MSMPPNLEQSAVVLDQPGDPATMRVAQIEVPPPGPGEIRLEVLACGLNPVDWKLAKSGLPDWSWPHVLGQDIVGIITDVGPMGIGLTLAATQRSTKICVATAVLPKVSWSHRRQPPGYLLESM